MEFLSTLDIDGISEHTQLFSLSHEQVNMVVKDTITNTVKQLKAKFGNDKEFLVAKKFLNEKCEEIWNVFPGFSQYEVRSALAKCGLTTKHIESKVKVLSGGEQAKVRLCKLINRESNILLLDEPTNHLDVDAKEELKRSLKAYKGSILMVCHEPEFYDGLATDVWDCTKWTTRLL